MDLKQIEYIVKIAETGSITKAAEQLYITQSALNQQLLKLESSLGIKLFYRHKHDMTLTKAGDVYVKYGKHMLQEKQEAYNIIQDLAKNNLGDLNMTFSRERGIDMLIATYPTFHKKFPGMTLKPHEMYVSDQVHQVVKGYSDMGIITLNPKYRLPELEYFHIRNESMLLALPRENPLAANAAPPGTYIEDLPYMELQKCKDLPFVLVQEKSTMRKIIDESFKANKFSPSLLLESGSIRALLNMVKNNMVATVVASAYYKFQDKIAYYRIPGDPFWELCVVYKKGTYKSKPMKYYQELILQYFAEKAPLMSRRKA